MTSEKENNVERGKTALRWVVFIPTSPWDKAELKILVKGLYAPFR